MEHHHTSTRKAKNLKDCPYHTAKLGITGIHISGGV